MNRHRLCQEDVWSRRGQSKIWNMVSLMHLTVLVCLNSSFSIVPRGVVCDSSEVLLFPQKLSYSRGILYGHNAHTCTYILAHKTCTQHYISSDISTTLRSSVSKQHFVPITKFNINKRAFSVAEPTNWNPLPVTITSTETIATFHKNSKPICLKLLFHQNILALPSRIFGSMLQSPAKTIVACPCC